MAFVRYTFLRILVLLAVAGVFYLLGLRGLLLALVAIFVSGLVSLFVLKGSRDAASESLYGRLQAINRRIDERASAEDAWDDERRRDEPPAPAP